VVLSAAALVGATAALGRAVIPHSPITKQLTVTSDWVNTGFAVEKDRCYRLTVTGSCQDTAGASFGPDGTCPVLFRTALGPIKDLPLATYRQCYVGQHPIRALLARIGDKAWSIHVGPGLTFIAPASGPVSVRINEPPAASSKPRGSLTFSLERVSSPRFVGEDGRTSIWAHIDDIDYLLLTPEGLQWEYGGAWARVGMHNGVFPTLVNGIAWWPDWTDPVRSSMLETPEFKPAAEGKQQVRTTDVNARHGLVQVEKPAAGIVRIRFRDTELGSGDIGCTLTLATPPPAR
jgi:hypothetical protein